MQGVHLPMGPFAEKTHRKAPGEAFFKIGKGFMVVGNLADAVPDAADGEHARHPDEPVHHGFLEDILPGAEDHALMDQGKQDQRVDEAVGVVGAQDDGSVLRQGTAFF